MNAFDFQLVYQVPVPDVYEDPVDWADDYVEALLGSGCDDASIGSGRQGILSIDFHREATTAREALKSALRDVARAIPDAKLVSCGPDLVGMPEIAAVLQCRRQTLQEQLQRGTFPFPMGGVDSRRYVWHLAPVLRWWLDRERGAPERLQAVDRMLSLAEVSMLINQQLAMGASAIDRSELDEIQGWFSLDPSDRARL